jgi:Plant mobile domain
MGEMTKLDKALIIAPVEWWRPETSMFHPPVGEMMLTLQICCLWGLSIQDI